MRAASVASLLRAAGFVVRKVPTGARGGAFAATVPGQPEADSIVFEAAGPLTLAVRVALPAECEAAGRAPTSETGLQLIGALNLGLQSQGLQVSPIAHTRGLEAFVISQHVCREISSPELLKDRLTRLHRTAERVSRALTEPASRLFVAVRQAAGVRHAAARPGGGGQPALVPTFDRDAIERMAHERRRRSRRARGAPS